MNARWILAAALVVGVVTVVVLFTWRGGSREALTPAAVSTPEEQAGAELAEPAVQPAKDEEASERVPAAGSDGVNDVPDPAETELAAPAFDREAIAGRVLVRDEGGPIAGATVRAFEPDVRGDGNEPAAETVTDAEGRFHLGELEPLTEYRVEVDAAGFVRAEEDLTTGRVADISLRRGLSLAGHVLRASDRSPVADVELVAQFRQTVLNRTRSASDGAFALTGLPAKEPIALLVRAPKRLVEQVRVQLNTSEEGYELLFDEPRALTVQLVDLRTGLPLGGLAGRFDEYGTGIRKLHRGSSFTTDAEGRFQLLWSSGARQFDPFPTHGDRAEEPTQLLFEVTADGYCITQAAVSLEEEREHVVPLSRGATVEGRVTNDGGVPMAGVRVELHRRGTRGTNPLTPDSVVEGLPPGIRIGEALKPVASTDAEGAYSIGQLAARSEETALRASSPGWARADVPVAVPEADESVQVDITLERAATIGGRVLVDGEPFLGTVRAAYGGMRKSCRTSAVGEYLFVDVVPGSLELSVWDEDLPSSRSSDLSLRRETVFVRSGEELDHDILLDAESVGTTVSGVVLSSDGEPLEEIPVYVVDPEAGRGSFGPNGWMLNAGSETVSGVGGRFEITVRTDDPLVEVCALRAGITARREVEPGATGVELVLPAMGSLAISVVDPDTGGSPARAEHVRWWKSGTPRREMPAGAISGFARSAEGTFELELAEGSWNVELDVAGYAYATLQDVRVRAGEVTAETVELSSGTTLVLDFYSDEGGPPPEISAILLEVDDYERAKAGDMLIWMFAQVTRAVRTDESGRATLRHLAPGIYELVNPPDEWDLDPLQFEVPDEERHTVEVRCRLR